MELVQIQSKIWCGFFFRKLVTVSGIIKLLVLFTLGQTHLSTQSGVSCFELDPWEGLDLTSVENIWNLYVDRFLLNFSGEVFLDLQSKVQKTFQKETEIV